MKIGECLCNELQLLQYLVIFNCILLNPCVVIPFAETERKIRANDPEYNASQKYAVSALFT